MASADGLVFYGLPEFSLTLRRFIYMLNVTVHENYNYTTLANNIGLVKVSYDFQFPACIRPICVNNGSKTPWQGSHCKFAGWGSGSANSNVVKPVMSWFDVSISSNASCTSGYGNVTNSFCAENPGVGICNGDNGAPLACRQGSELKYYLFGLASNFRNQCGSSADLYTDVGRYWNWINHTINHGL